MFFNIFIQNLAAIALDGPSTSFLRQASFVRLRMRGERGDGQVAICLLYRL